MRLTFYDNKALKHPQRLADYLNGKGIMPVTLDIDLTDRCNSKCPGCVGDRGKGQPSLDTGIAKALLLEASQLGIESVVFTGGGEPTLHEGLGELLRFSAALNLKTALVTNGVALARRPELTAAIVQTCSWVRVSLDAGTQATYEKVHGVDLFDQAQAGIAALVQCRNGHESRTPTIGVAYLTGKETVHDIPDACRLARHLGADYLYLRPFLGDRIAVMARSYQDWFGTDTFEVLGAAAYCHFHEMAKTYPHCGFGWWVSVVKADGNVTWCCRMRAKPQYFLGNLYLDKLADILARRKAVEVDFSDCELLCRGDEFNRFLHAAILPIMHEEFL